MKSAVTQTLFVFLFFSAHIQAVDDHAQAKRKHQSEITSISVGNKQVSKTAFKPFYYGGNQTTFILATSKGTVHYSWEYLHTIDPAITVNTLPENGWIKITDATKPSVDFEDILSQNQNQPGIYFIRPRSKSRSLVQFIVADLLELQASSLTVFKGTPVNLSAILDPDIPNNNIRYTFSGDGATVRWGNNLEFQAVHNDKLTGPAEINVQWQTPGRKTVTAIAGNESRSVTVQVINLKDFAFVKPFLMIRPSELMKEPPATTPDADNSIFYKLELQIGYDNKTVILGTEASREAVALLHDHGFTARFIYPNLYRKNKRLLLPDNFQRLSTPLPPDNEYGCVYDFAAHSVEENMKFLNNLWVANYSSSISEEFITCELSAGNISETAQTSLVTFNLFMRFAPGVDLLPNGTLEPEDPLNKIYNPAVIVVNSPDEDGLIPPDKVALFQVGDGTLDAHRPLLTSDIIEWHINPVPLPENGMEQGDAEFVDEAGIPLPDPHLAHGVKTRINGRHEGFLQIGIKIKDEPEYTITYLCYVGHEKQIPYCLNFFADNSNPAVTTDIIARTGNAIKIMNIIYRQVGIRFIPAENPAQIITPEVYAASLVPLDSDYYAQRNIQVIPPGPNIFLQTVSPLDTQNNATKFRLFDQNRSILKNLQLEFIGSASGIYVYGIKEPISTPVPINENIRIGLNLDFENILVENLGPESRLYKNLPDWMIKNCPEDFPRITIQDHAVNFNIQCSTNFCRATLNGEALHVPDNPAIDYLALEGTYNEAGTIKTMTLMPPINRYPYPGTYTICNINAHTMYSRDEKVFEKAYAHTLAHEGAHTLRLRHRHRTLREDADGVQSPVQLPIESSPKLSNSENLMYYKTAPIKEEGETTGFRPIDLDLLQAIALRNSILAQDIPMP